MKSQLLLKGKPISLENHPYKILFTLSKKSPTEQLTEQELKLVDEILAIPQFKINFKDTTGLTALDHARVNQQTLLMQRLEEAQIFLPKTKDHKAALYLLILCTYQDGFYQFKTNNEQSSNNPHLTIVDDTRRFLTISSKLPFDILMLLSNFLAQQKKVLVKANLINFYLEKGFFEKNLLPSSETEDGNDLPQTLSERSEKTVREDYALLQLTKENDDNKTLSTLKTEFRDRHGSRSNTPCKTKFQTITLPFLLAGIGYLSHLKATQEEKGELTVGLLLLTGITIYLLFSLSARVYFLHKEKQDLFGKLETQPQNPEKSWHPMFSLCGSKLEENSNRLNLQPPTTTPQAETELDDIAIPVSEEEGVGLVEIGNQTENENTCWQPLFSSVVNNLKCNEKDVRKILGFPTRKEEDEERDYGYPLENLQSEYQGMGF